jgi:hypothetical protein
VKTILYSLFLFVVTLQFDFNAQPQRCATHTPSQVVYDNSLYKLTATRTIPVIFHVIHLSNGTGSVPDYQLYDQLDSLNGGYLGSDYQFFLAGICRTQNNTLHYLTGNEVSITNSLSIDPKHALNIYIGNAGSYLGWVYYFPWEAAEDNKLHGVFIDYRSLPGGSFSGYDEGNTATHEVGHYLGLYHTFQGGCTPPGDEVDDTPYHTVNFGCPSPFTNTCPIQPGYDPIHNYMNYTDDPCMFEFTSGQYGRSSNIVGQYKPNLGGTTLYLNSNLTISSTQNWHFYSGLTIQFASAKSLTVSGSLYTTGTTLKFTTTNPYVSDARIQVNGTITATNSVFTSSSTWNGINFASGSSGNINGGTISKVQVYGGAAVYISNNASVTVQNCTIENNNTGQCNGISISGSSGYRYIYNNIIRTNSNHGISIVNSGNAYLRYNTITGLNSTGKAAVYCDYFSTPLFAVPAGGYEEGRNTLQNGYYGLYGNYYCNISAGSQSIAYNNRFLNNSYANVYASYNTTIL